MRTIIAQDKKDIIKEYEYNQWFMSSTEFDNLPNLRDGLTRKERIVLYCLLQIQKERGGNTAPTAMLYGRVVEYVDMSENELQLILQRLSNRIKRESRGGNI